MGIFSNKFKRGAERFAAIIHREFSNPLNFIWLHVVTLFALIIGASVMSIFGGLGMQSWWQHYSTINPNVIPEQTIQYWIWIIADKLLGIAIALQTCYIAVLCTVWVLNESKREGHTAIIKNTSPETPSVITPQTVTTSVTTTVSMTPVCPKCKNTFPIIRKGTQNGKTRYRCKICGTYFQS